MKVGLVGLGPIGLEVGKVLVASPAFEFVGAADLSSRLVGRGLGELLPGAPAGLKVEPRLAGVLALRPEAVVLCTRSLFREVAEDLAAIVAAGAHAVTSCEELASPPEDPEARALHEAAERAGVAILATGVNPGFVMDRWPLQLAAMCVSVQGVVVERVVDAGQRREPLRNKVGHGLSSEEFQAAVAAGRVGHVGLRASATLLARGLGTELASAEEDIIPVTGADGRTLGVRQELRGRTADDRPIELRLQMSVGAPVPHDRVILDADPPIDARVVGGLHGDRATVAALVEGLRRLSRPSPRAGLLTIADLY
ncbi:MAG TPA: dihydrodipicolinate reductase [Polyangia bacterium]|jgi:4-hydroxy-tetrahydrodipicolinate reductase|nr:dihydrodipicolinate reductase [Polyangia bacterium]